MRWFSVHHGDALCYIISLDFRSTSSLFFSFLQSWFLLSQNTSILYSKKVIITLDVHMSTIECLNKFNFNNNLTGLILGITGSVVVAIIVICIAFCKLRGRDEGTYKVDESQNFSSLQPKKSGGNMSMGGDSGGGRRGKKKDVKEWYVWRRWEEPQVFKTVIRICLMGDTPCCYNTFQQMRVHHCLFIYWLNICHEFLASISQVIWLLEPF